MPRRRFSYKTGLPAFIAHKIYKTGQTRGADKDTIYQNRVSRTSTVLIPFDSYAGGQIIPEDGFENDFIVIIKPADYFSDRPPAPREGLPTELKVGRNMLVFYETKRDWERYNPQDFGWHPASHRKDPLGGEYVARIPDTTREGDSEIRRGFTGRSEGAQGAGIRVFEYASAEQLRLTRHQLAFLAWRAEGIEELSRAEGEADPGACKDYIDQYCQRHDLADVARLGEARVLREGKAVCPLCLKPITAQDLATKVEQAEGRQVTRQAITPASLFHVKELRVGQYNHLAYNLGWGHHHCNAVARDIGIEGTLEWMQEVLNRNRVTG